MSLFVVDVEADGPASDWKKLRKTKHTHNPVDDAKGNAEALLALAKQYGLRLPK